MAAEEGLDGPGIEALFIGADGPGRVFIERGLARRAGGHGLNPSGGGKALAGSPAGPGASARGRAATVYDSPPA
jgi:hypothetical protein